MSQRQLFGIFTACFLVVANMIGAGVLSAPAWLNAAIPSHGINLLLWAVAGLVSLCGAACLAEMASAYPTTGGDYVYVMKSFGRRIGFVYGLTMLVVGFAAPMALMTYTLATLVAPLVTPLLGGPANAGSITVISIACILITGFLHSRGYEESSRTQDISTIVKIVLISILAGLMVFSRESTLLQHLNWSTAAGQSKWSWAEIASNLTLILYCYTGWNAVAYISGELAQPERAIRISLIGGTAIVVSIYLSLNLGFMALFSTADMLELTAIQRDGFLNVALAKLFGPGWIADAFAIGIGASIYASISSTVISGSRLTLAMAQDGLLPSHLQKSCAKTGLPKFAIWGICILACLFLMSGSFEMLLQYVGFSLVIVSAFVISPIFILRGRDDYHPRFRVPFYPVVPLIFLSSCLVIFVVGSIAQPWSSLLGLATVMVAYILCPMPTHSRKPARQ